MVSRGQVLVAVPLMVTMGMMAVNCSHLLIFCAVGLFSTVHVSTDAGSVTNYIARRFGDHYPSVLPGASTSIQSFSVAQAPLLLSRSPSPVSSPVLTGSRSPYSSSRNFSMPPISPPCLSPTTPVGGSFSPGGSYSDSAPCQSHAPFGSPSKLQNMGPSHHSQSPVSYADHGVPWTGPVVSSAWDRKAPANSPGISPSPTPMVVLSPPILAWPPPPPSEDCSSMICSEPYTNSPGSKCFCVLPMQVGLRLGVDLYTFFPLVSELASEIAGGIFLEQSQVRIMGANSASQELGKTIVLVNLVPSGTGFDNATSFLTSERFWHKEVPIKSYFFGDYDVLYVHYPGLPPSPPTIPSGSMVAGGTYPNNNNNAIATKPLGVDVGKRKKTSMLSTGLVAAISLSALVAVALLAAIPLTLVVRKRKMAPPSENSQRSMHPFISRPSGSTVGHGLSSASFGSSIAAYTGSAKTYSTTDIIRATNNFDRSRILGEGGFGRVYSGAIDDGSPVALKVLKRDDHQSGREFLAEVEMLSRLHHRNLVKLIGICTEEGARCLVYELIPNGSVESHLHGIHKDSSPLNWDARIKIALGAARGLAYLHEDSNPRVIHRDFKSSNILLEWDFTPKVSDFGLARTAFDEESKHISTRVMGTFGYVAPEYAMTGHLLVKSDVYSYGVVLLELLTGRKPVNMSQPPGQENLVSWARPLLGSREGLEELIDPSLDQDVTFDSVAKVAAIASMCVQPEVSHRPFMGEVVQALKLICHECDDAKEATSPASTHNGNARTSASCRDQNVLPAYYDSEPDIERGLPLSDLYLSSGKYMDLVSGSSRRNSFSGPLMSGKSRNPWHKARRSRRESASEHGFLHKFWSYSQ